MALDRTAILSRTVSAMRPGGLLPRRTVLWVKDHNVEIVSIDEGVEQLAQHAADWVPEIA